VAVDLRGDAFAVWERHNANANRRVQGTTRPAGGAWSGAVDVSGAGRDAYAPQLAVDAQGNAIAVWARTGASHTTVQAAARVAGAGWQTPVNISPPGQDAYSADVAVDPLGNAAAVWERSDDVGRVVQGAVRAAAAGWQAPVDLSAPSVEPTLPRVALDARGNAIAVWVLTQAAGDLAQSAVRPAGGAWQAPVSLSTAAQRASDAQVAVDGQDNAVAVWQRGSAAGVVVQSAARPAGGSWQAPATLSAAARLNRSRPQVAVDPRGNAIAVWERHDAAKFVVQAAVRPAGGTWQSPANLSAPCRDAFDPQVAVDPQGNAIAVWERHNAAASVVQGALRPAGGRWQAPVDLSATPRLRLSPSTFRAGSRTRVSYALSVAARVRFTVERAGRRRRGRVIAAFTRRRRAGPDAFTFTARVAGRTLKPGRYRLVARPSGKGFTGRPARVAFVIAR